MWNIDKGEDKGANKWEAKDDQDYLNLLSIHLRAESESEEAKKSQMKEKMRKWKK